MKSRILRAAACWCCLLLVALPVWAADDDYPEYQETARVVRISLLQGDVNLRRAGRTVWESARLNYPIVEGDILATDQGSRLEIQIDGRSFVRVAPNTVLRFVTLRDEGIALSVSEGTITVRLRRFEPDREYFEIDAPRTTLSAERAGVYRADAERDGRVRFTARKEGRGRVYSDTSGFTLRDDKTAEFVPSGNNDGDWEFFAAGGREDFWDEWERDRDQYVTSHYRYYDDGRYPAGVWGGEELDAYGDWVQHDSYGWIWRPNRAYTSRYSNWAPYRYGRWVWCPPYGWTWAGDEPWGWTPYHYGRWVYWQNDWCWTPYVGYSWNNYRWRPALVSIVFVNNSYGERACWYPLGWGQRDPRGHHGNRARPLRPNEIAELPPGYINGVSTLPVRDFGRDGGAIRPAPQDIAKTALGGDPIRGGGPPVTPGDGRPPARNGGGEIDVPGGGAVRNTGAGERQTGQALGGELYKKRIYGGREPVVRDGAETDGMGGGGAVRRPDSGTGRTIQRDGGPVRNSEKPAYNPPPVRASDNSGAETDRPYGAPRRDGNSNKGNTSPEPAPRPRVVLPPKNSGGNNSNNGETDRPYGAPSRGGNGSTPAPRQETPKPRYEPPPRSEPPRSEPPRPKYEPPPRSEPPPRPAPAPRNDPPPKSEPKRESPRPPSKAKPDDPNKF